MKVRQCDRCKKYYRDNNVTHNGDLVVGVALIVERGDMQMPVCSYKKDLCDECAKDLDKWFERGVEKDV